MCNPTLQPIRLFTYKVDHALIGRMKPITDIRRDNLARVLRDSKVSQTTLAKIMGLGSPSIVNQHVRGTKTVGDKFARRYESALGLTENWLDTDQSSGPAMTFGRNSLQTPLDIGDGYLLIPRLDESKSLASSVGTALEDEGQRFPVHTTWFRESGVRQNSAATWLANNDDMAPRIRRGDTVLLQIADGFRFESGGIYLLGINGELMMRRAFYHPSGGLKLIADNPDKQRHPDWELSKADGEALQILARVSYTFGKVE